MYEHSRVLATRNTHRESTALHTRGGEYSRVLTTGRITHHMGTLEYKIPTGTHDEYELSRVLIPTGTHE